MSRDLPPLDTNMVIIIEDDMVHTEQQVPKPTTKNNFLCDPSNIEIIPSEKETVPQNKTDDLTEKVPPESNGSRYLLVFHAINAYCMKQLFTGSISPIADVLTEEYNVSLAAVGLLSSSIFLLGLIFSIPSGIILQLVSYQKMLFVAWFGLIVSILLFGFTESLIFGILLRGMAGAFGACTWLIVVGFGAQYFGNNSLSVITALTLCYTRTVCFAGVTVQAYVYQKYQMWREIYFVLAAIGIIFVIAYAVTILTSSPAADITSDEDVIADDNNDENEDDTRIGTALHKYTHSAQLSLSLTPGPIDLQFPLFDVQQTEPTTTPAVETKAVSPPKKGNAFTNYLNWASCAVGFVNCAVIEGLFGMWLIPYLMIKFNFDRVTASLTVGIGPWSYGFGALLIGYLAAKYKKRKIFLCFGIVSMSAIFVIIYLENIPEFVILVVVILVGMGSGSVCLLFTLVREYNSSNHCEDSATGLLLAFCIGSAFVAQNVIGVLLDYHRSNVRNDHDLSDYKTEDYQFAFSIFLPTCIIIQIIATFLLKETNGKNL